MHKVDFGGAMNRVASAAHTFGGGAPPRHSPTQPPPDRTPSGLVSTKVRQPSHDTIFPSNTKNSKRFGDVDTTSKMSMLTSSLSKKGGNPVVKTSPPPPAFGQPKNTFAPPPRRTPSAPAPEPAGEWAEALYDYESGVRACSLRVRVKLIALNL